ncbi:maleylpyruvate isomerase N-terminal domain-containing protein [Actinotalea solisilvae]|uniref:maleylpyruvate isomerase N-terminal domain-containing protein n=1 Tax=Actinotalea solisilvae TaxID=2072922 RepID=UPI0018F26DA6|nr:maleylpyruvate isomerase N-terminal domain-containing protein [Actinotalea solisilvae]
MTTTREPRGRRGAPQHDAHHATPPSPPGVDAPGPLALERYLALVPAAARALAAAADEAGPDAAVPTCPRWAVADLVAHQGMVHRWAASHVLGHRGRTPEGRFLPSEAAYLREVPRDGLTAWLVRGADDLVAALADASDDVRAMTFLHAAPAPRVFWARRQTHETTVHAVDAVAARLGRTPTTAEAVEALGLTPDVALDGLDELLRGFVTRGAARIRRDEPFTVLVRPGVDEVDGGRAGSRPAWLLHVDEAVVTALVDPAAPPDRADVRVTGSPAALYLGLWNRGDEMTVDEMAVDGRPGFLDAWRAKQRVRWS